MPISFLREARHVHWLAALLVLAACGSTPQNSPPRDLTAARATAQNAKALPLEQGFRRNLSHARAVFVVSPGSGAVALARVPGSPQFSGPAFYDVTRLSASTGSAGTGFSRLPQEREVIAAFMTDKSMDWLKAPAPPGKASLRVVAAAAPAAEQSSADILVLDLKAPEASRVEMDLNVIKPDEPANQAWYGKNISPKDIFARLMPATGDALALQQAIIMLSQEPR